LSAGAFCLAWSAIFVRWAGVPGVVSGFYRVLVATIVLVPWRLLHRSGPAPSRKSVAFAILAGIFFALDLAFYNSSVLRTAAGTATRLGNNAPLFVGLGVWLLFGEKPTREFWLGLVLALAGTSLLMLSSSHATT